MRGTIGNIRVRLFPPESPPTMFIHPGQQCRDADGNSLREAMTHGARTWGNHPEHSTVFLVGAYEYLSDISDRLLRALPPVLTVARADWDSLLVPLLCDNAAHGRAGARPIGSLSCRRAAAVSQQMG